MMAQNDLVVVGIDVAKDKVDACIRALSHAARRFQAPQEGRRKLIAWLRKHKVGKAVMEASGGYERDWARALREAGIEVRIVDPKRVRSFARSAGRLAKNDAIDAEMIAWFAETFSEAPGQAYDAAREKLVALVNARRVCSICRPGCKARGEHAAPGAVQKAHAPRLEEDLPPKSPSSRLRSPPRSRPHRILPSSPRSSRACRACRNDLRRTSSRGCRNWVR